MDRFPSGCICLAASDTLRLHAFAHVLIAFSATTGWYRRPSLHLIHPRAWSRTDLSHLACQRRIGAPIRSFSGNDAAGAWCDASHHRLSAAK